MSCATVCASQLMYAVAKAATAAAAVLDAPRALSRGGGGEGYSCVACARASGDGRALCPAPQPAHASAAANRTLAGRTPYSPAGCRATNPAELRISGCQPIPALPSPGPAALCVSHRSPATYMKMWSAEA